MASVKEHYNKLLAPYYSWSQGGSEQQLNANRAFFEKHAVYPENCGIALDLGAGSGFQSIPLAEMGFQVTAIDINRKLLRELRQKAGKLRISIVQEDLLHFFRRSPPLAELIICMGDTLTHLNTLQEVRRLIRKSKSRLMPRGRLFLSFRDMSVPAKELDRFVPVRSDTDLIFTCFLEYEYRSVKVHDLIYTRSKDRWILHKSFYRKLRISTSWLTKQIETAGMCIEHLQNHKGMTTLIARKI